MATVSADSLFDEGIPQPEGIDTTLAVGETLTADRQMDLDTFQYEIAGDDDAGTTVVYQKSPTQARRFFTQAGAFVSQSIHNASQAFTVVLSLATGRRSGFGVVTAQPNTVGNNDALFPGEPQMSAITQRAAAGLAVQGDAICATGGNQGEFDYYPAPSIRWVPVSADFTARGIGEAYLVRAPGVGVTRTITLPQLSLIHI